jgi:hypothetical protein
MMGPGGNGTWCGLGGFGLAVALAALTAGEAKAGCIDRVCNVTIDADPGTDSQGTTGGPGTLSHALA